MKEKILRAVELLYQSNVKEAYEIIAAMIQDMEGILNGLSPQSYPQVIAILSRIIQLMNDKKTLELAQTLQFDFLPFVYGEVIDGISREQAAANGFAAQYKNVEEDAVIVVFGILNKEYITTIQNNCNNNLVIFYHPGIWDMEDMEKLPSNVYLLADFDKDEKLSDKHKYDRTEFPLVLKECITEANKNKVYISALPGNKEQYKAEYETFKEKIQFRLEMVSINSYTAKALGHIVVKNNLNIFPFLLNGYCIDSFVGSFPDNLAAIIVSAGPSLLQNVEQLKNIKGKALIVCVDTAAHTLLERDIIPDFIVTVDPRKDLSLFDDVRIKDIPIIGSSDMSCNVLSKIQCRNLIMASVKNPFIQKLYEREKHHVDELESGGSVATFAYSFCKFVGIKKIVFIGQDLALTGNQMYAGKEKINMDKFNRELISVEKYGGGTVYTTRDYYSYLIWFEQQVQMNKDIVHLNATQGGARIHGVQECSLEEVIQKWAVENMDVKGYINQSMIPVFDDKEKAKDEIYNYEQRYFEIGIQLERAGNAAKRLQNNGVLSKDEKKQAEDIIQNTVKMFDESTQAFLILREVDATNLDEYMDICSTEVEKNTLEHYRLLERYFACLLRATKNIQNIILEKR